MTQRRDWIGEAEGDLDYQFGYLTVAIGDQIAGRMQELGLTQADLAKRMGVTPGRVSQIMRGPDNLTLKSLVAVAHALDAQFDVQLTANAEVLQARKGAAR